MRVVGVDASKRDWVGVVLADGCFDTAVLSPTLAALLDATSEVQTVGIDIPLGSVAAAVRGCDTAARRFVAPFGSSVFAAPPRGALACETYADANQWCRDRWGRGMSAQSWALRAKVADAEAHWIERPDLVFEVHPEVSFRAMAHDHRPLTARKRSWTCHQQRLALLAAAGVVVPTDLGDAGRSGADDVLDAAAAAWSAHRIATGVATSILDPPERDEQHAHPVAIWY